LSLAILFILDTVFVDSISNAVVMFVMCGGHVNSFSRAI
jgi:hypothetical protein